LRSWCPHLFRNLGRRHPRQGGRAKRCGLALRAAARRPTGILRAGSRMVQRHRELASHPSRAFFMPIRSQQPTEIGTPEERLSFCLTRSRKANNLW